MQKKICVIGSILFFIAIIQSTLLEYFKVMNIKPNLFLIFIIAAALQREQMEAAITGLVAGFFLDVIVGKALGLNAILGLVIAYFIGIMNTKLYRENIFVLTSFTFVLTCVFELLFYLMIFILKGYEDIFYVISSIILPEAIYNSIVAIVFYPLIAKLYGKLDKLNSKHMRL